MAFYLISFLFGKAFFFYQLIFLGINGISEEIDHFSVFPYRTARDLLPLGIHNLSVHYAGIVMHDIVGINDYKSMAGRLVRLDRKSVV